MRLEIREDILPMLQAVMKACWLRDPLSRPTFGQIAVAIREHPPVPDKERPLTPESVPSSPTFPVLDKPALRSLMAIQLARGRKLPPSVWGGYARSCLNRWRQVLHSVSDSGDHEKKEE